MMKLPGGPYLAFHLHFENRRRFKNKLNPTHGVIGSNHRFNLGFKLIIGLTRRVNHRQIGNPYAVTRIYRDGIVHLLGTCQINQCIDITGGNWVIRGREGQLGAGNKIRDKIVLGTS
jgi:hypothetical protein